MSFPCSFARQWGPRSNDDCLTLYNEFQFCGNVVCKSIAEQGISFRVCGIASLLSESTQSPSTKYMESEVMYGKGN